MVHEGTRELEAEMTTCPIKYLGLGGGEGEKAQSRPRLSLQHPPHDLVLYTADIQDHLCRINRLKLGKRRLERHRIEYREV
jgi:hypothetical protein